MTVPNLVPVLAERLSLVVDVPPFGPGPPDAASIAAFDAFGAPIDGYEKPDVDVFDTVAPGPHGDVPVRVYRPRRRQAHRGLVWAHGGAFIGGDLEMPESDVVARELADRDGIVVVAVDYRLCNGGVHFPVPHDDLNAAFLWAVDVSGLLPTGAPWSVGGASAGGNLAAGVAQRRRDEGSAEPDSVVLAYPVLHDPLPDLSVEQRALLDTLPAVLRFPAEATAFLNRNFLGDRPSDVPYAFAALGDVRGLPRTRIIVCEFDDLAPSGAAYAQQLREAGVDVELEFVRGVTHGHLNVPGLAEMQRSIEGIVDFLTRGEGTAPT
jgi:acetyl esterase